ncbi:hypothetical protein VH571_07795 [Frondihabitans sp. 4ASC-45]|uniref:hypothetical protein n=1 Tax=Frondihabitans sp. 4ASC-45 TaxID=3111636 RepID=UPI003C246428
MSTTLLQQVAPPPPPDGIDDVSEPEVPADLAAYRRRYRRRLLWWSVVPVVLIVLVALKLLSLPTLAALSQATYDRGAYEQTTTISDGLAPVNVIEPWVRHFERGTGLAGVGVIVDARGEFERALQLVPVANVRAVCMIRTNLALVVEQQGDSARLDGDQTSSTKFYTEALALIDASPDGCFDNSDGAGTPPTKKPLDDEKARLQQKQQGSGGEDGGQGQGGSNQGDQGQGDQNGQGDSGSPSDGSGQGDSQDGDGSSGSSGKDPLDQLQQQNGDAQKQQQENNDRNRQFDQNDGDYSGKPW